MTLKIGSGGSLTINSGNSGGSSQGPQGTQGAQGAQGPAGTAGIVSGSENIVYEVDFSTLSSQSFSAGSVTIDGKTWICGSSNVSLVNGQGLQLTPSAGTTEYIIAPIGSFGLTNKNFRIYVQMDYSGAVNSSVSNTFVSGYQWDYNGSNFAQPTGNWVQNGYVNNTSINRYASSFGANTVDYSDSHDTFITDIQGDLWYLYDGVYSSRWPSENECMERICHRTADQYGPWGNGIQRSNMGSVYFLAYRNYKAGANSFTGIVKKLKIVTM